jgi:hypothetical protein
MSKKIIILFLVFTHEIHVCKAQQNLVPNASFESVNSCPHSGGEMYRLENWYSASMGSPDYYNSCNDTTYINGNVGVPDNFNGSQFAHSGNGYVGIVVGTVANFREYIEVELIDSLLFGRKYIFKMYVSLSDSSWYSCNTFGAYLSNSSITSTLNTNLLLTPQLTNRSGNNLNDKYGWSLIEDTIIANGGEKYLTIGNFNTDSLSETYYVGSGGNSTGYFTSYYFLDDISLVLDSTTGIGEINKKDHLLEVWPNPFSGKLNIACYLNDQNPGQIFIYNSPGNLILFRSISEPYSIFDLESLPAGVYFINFYNRNKTTLWKKIIKEF